MVLNLEDGGFRWISKFRYILSFIYEISELGNGGSCVEYWLTDTFFFEDGNSCVESLDYVTAFCKNV